MSEFKPNTTQYPNFLFDLMPSLKEGELRLLNAIVRKTYGWQKQKDKISLSQMIELTGMSKQGILDARERLINKGIIKAEMVNGIMEYMVVIPEDSLVNNVDLNKCKAVKIEQAGSLNQPQIDVHNVDTQKKQLQNKNTKEREETHAHTQAKEPIKLEDPLFPTASMSEGQIVMNVIQDFLDEHWDKMAVDTYQMRECQLIYGKLREDDKVAQLKRCLILYKYGVKKNGEKTYWGDTPPQPGFLLRNWNDIYSAKLPLWFERGFTSQAEYEADLIKTKPASHSSMDDLKRQFFSGPLMSKEEAENALMELDQLKETINGKN